MKKILIALFLTIFFLSCVIRPKGFTYNYQAQYTGIDTMINIEGYYVLPHGCDTSFYSMFMFYPDGLFTIATTSRLMPELHDCFEYGGNSPICNYPLWGTYHIENDTIFTQTVRLEGNGFVIFRDFVINNDKTLSYLNDYVNTDHINLGYMANYPSFKGNICDIQSSFYPLANKRDIKECPLLKKKWFFYNEK